MFTQNKKYRRKRALIIALAMTAAASFSACGKTDSGSHMKQENQVEKAINQQMSKENKDTTTEKSTEDKEKNTENKEKTTEKNTENTTEVKDKTTEKDDKEKTETSSAKPADVVTTEENTDTRSENFATVDIDPETIDYDKVDIDITEMSSDMVYATVYQMVYNPQDYIGKTVKISGQYYVAYSNEENNDNFYNYCLVADAKACCQQGLEFKCIDGHEVYPDDFPEDGTDVEVTGVFEMYREGKYTYTRLNYAEMTVDGASKE
ncbi:MAG: hypothetical protein K6C35_04715 [Eubacterium sp.]|nr:hypothetical protein [Eubacterium sp.]